MNGQEQPAASPRPMPRWVKLALWGSAACMIAGTALALTASPPQGPVVDAAPAGLAARSAAEGAVQPAAGARAQAVWDSSLFRVGLSFIAAFTAGWVVRPWLKTATMVVGAALAILYGLHAAGLVDVHWKELEAHYGGAGGWIAAQTQSLTALLTGALPSTGAAGAGLAAGLRRR